MTTNNKISSVVSSQVPFFVRNDHPGIVTFLKKYYEFTEQNGGVIDRIKNLTNYSDIDRTTDELAEKFYNHFIVHVPNWAIADKRLIVKHVKDFYLSRGTERSIQFLINILFGVKTEFYYPKKDILRASDGRWFIEKSLKILDTKINGSPNDDLLNLDYIANKTIKGNTSNATAIVEAVSVYYEKLSLVREIKLSNQTKDFISGEEIFTTFSREGNEYSFTANVFSGFISELTLKESGSGYVAGTFVPVESDTGTGANVQIESVSVGNVKSLFLVYGGAGFSVDDQLEISSGSGGSGANASVISVDLTETYHPNTYTIVTANINTFAANTLQDLAGNIISDFAFTAFNLGPITAVTILSGGSNYLTIPTVNVKGNTIIRNLNILGRMEIENGGSGYVVNNHIEFVNRFGGYGSGANAIVSEVDANGSITKVKFIPVPNNIVGGTGYNVLPEANVISSTGNGAVIVVTSVLGDGEIITASTDTIGKIQKLKLVEAGSGYKTPPKIRLDSFGDGLANAEASVITGIFSYPGRFIGAQGLLSTHNYLQDGEYYHNYSYVVRTPVDLNKYRKPLAELIHPSGLKFFSDYTFEDKDGTINVAARTANTSNYSNLSYDTLYTNKTFNMTPNPDANVNTSNMLINFNGYPYSVGDTIVLKFSTNSLLNTYVTVSSTSSNSFNVIYPTRRTANSTANGNVSVGTIL